MLPAGFVPLTWPWTGRSAPTSATGLPHEAALVSMVAFTDRDFRFNFWPATSVACGQINYRAYVRHGGQTGVWFFHTSLDSRLVAVPRRLWGMPWHRDQVAVTARWRDPGPTLDFLEVAADGASGATRVRLSGVGRHPGVEPVPGLDLGGPLEISDRYTDPTLGWFARPRGALRRYSVWHPRMRMVPARAVTARCALFERLGLIDADQKPVDARAIREVRFDVHTPPRRL